MADDALESDILVSVIVPVYGVEPYLDQCLASIAVQTYGNLQVIVVDDGSTDGSGALCDSWAARDPRFRVIHQENRGLSAARNAGLDKAVGDYVVFVDPDDYVEPTFVEVLLAAAQVLSVDCVICGIRTLNGRRSIETVPAPRPMVVSAHECLSRVVNAGRGERYPIDTAPWNRIYTRSLFEDNGIRFREGMVYEGTLSTFPLMHHAGRVGLIPDVLCVHRVRPGSITQTWTESNALDGIAANEEFVASIRACYPDLDSDARASRERVCIVSWIEWLNHRADADAAPGVADDMIAALQTESLRHWRDLRMPADARFALALFGLLVSPGLTASLNRARHWLRGVLR